MQTLQIARHSRGLAPPPPRVPAESDIAALTIDGDVVLVDLGDYILDGKCLGAVVRWDGSIGLEYVRHYDSTTIHTGERAGLYDVKPSEPSRTRESHACVVLGKVISRE